MFRRRTITNPANRTMVTLALSLAVHGLAAQTVYAGRPAGPQVISGEQLTKQQFKALPDSAVIEFKGQRLTKAQIRARAAQRGHQAVAKAQAADRQAQARVAAHEAQFLQQQQAKLQAENAKAMAEFARLRQARPTPQARQLEAIQQEAA